jgi:hypothetical protein
MTEESLFEEALSRSPKERAAFLAQACAGRPELRAAVEVLLAAHEKPCNMLDMRRILPKSCIYPSGVSASNVLASSRPAFREHFPVASWYTVCKDESERTTRRSGTQGSPSFPLR